MTYRNADLVKPFDHVAGGKKSPDGVRFQLPGGNAALFAEGNAQRLGKLAAGRAAKGRINHVKRERLFAISKKYLHPVFTRPELTERTALNLDGGAEQRSEGRRVGNECVGPGRVRGLPYQ